MMVLPGSGGGSNASIPVLAQVPMLPMTNEEIERSGGLQASGMGMSALNGAIGSSGHIHNSGGGMYPGGFVDLGVADVNGGIENSVEVAAAAATEANKPQKMSSWTRKRYFAKLFPNLKTSSLVPPTDSSTG